METDLLLRRKWTFRADGKQIILVKKHNEKSAHVLMKAFIWALYLPDYPALTVEVPIGDRYKPDVVALDELGLPRFWGEAGYLRVEKIRSLLRRHRSTHFAFAKWQSQLAPFAEIVTAALNGIKRDGPVDLLNFQEDSAERFIDKNGYINIAHERVEWLRL